EIAEGFSLDLDQMKRLMESFSISLDRPLGNRQLTHSRAATVADRWRTDQRPGPNRAAPCTAETHSAGPCVPLGQPRRPTEPTPRAGAHGAGRSPGKRVAPHRPARVGDRGASRPPGHTGNTTR